MRDVLAAFPSAKPSGSGWSACCPAHEDTRASLSIARGDTGAWLLCCHVGCSIEAVVSAAGLEMRDLAPEREGPAARVKKQEVAVYSYTDEDGQLLYQVVRYVPKSFAYRRPDGQGGWIWRLADMRRVLYRLNELKGRASIAIAEGEKDCDTLHAHGITATTNPMGAGPNKWRPEFTAQLVAAGVKRLAIFPDNDDDGRHHADVVARACHAAGLQVRIVALPNLGLKGDVTDWFAQGGTVAELKALVKRTTAYVPTHGTTSTTRPGTGASGPEELIVVTASQVTVRPVVWIEQNFLARGHLTVLAGPPGLGKTMLACRTAAEQSHHTHVLYVTSGEDGIEDTLVPRFIAHGADLTRIHLVRGVGRDGLAERGVTFRDTHLLDGLIEQFKVTGVFADPIADLLNSGVNDHRNTELRQELMPFVAWLDQRGLWALGIAHLNKSNGPAITRLLGGMGWAAVPRIVLAVAEDDEGRRYVACSKNNLGEKPPTRSFTIAYDGVFTWGTETDLTANQLLSQQPVKVIESSAVEWLRTFMLEHDINGVYSEEIFKEGKAAGFGRDRIYKAKEELGIKARPNAARDKWRWFMPVGEDYPEPIDTGNPDQTSGLSSVSSEPQEVRKSRKSDQTSLTSLSSFLRTRAREDDPSLLDNEQDF